MMVHSSEFGKGVLNESCNDAGGKGGGGAKGGGNWPSKTGNPSGGDRGNNPPKK